MIQPTVSHRHSWRPNRQFTTIELAPRAVTEFCCFINDLAEDKKVTTFSLSSICFVELYAYLVERWEYVVCELYVGG